MDHVTPLRDFLEIPYDRLEEMNLAAKQQRLDRVSPDTIREERMKYLTDEKRIKAVTVCFTDLEGRFHMLDYDKKFLLKAADNLTFDGSSIRGFSQQAESDLRLEVDWPAFYWLPSDIFGPGKVLAFGEVKERDGSPYAADMRNRLKVFANGLFAADGTIAHASNEIEGFLFKGRDAERQYHVTGAFEFISTGGYYHSLPGDALRRFIDNSAEAQRALGFGNEKDHPEVAPSQFEMNYGYTEACIAADQVQLYKLICRQVAQQLDMTASFLPKPVTGVNGSGMHTNLSLTKKRQERLPRRQGRGRAVGDRLELHRPHPGERERHLPDPQLERELVPPPRPALRGAQPDQGVGHQPGRDGAHPARQREVRARRGAVDRARLEPVPRAVRAAADGDRGARAGGRRDRDPALAHPVPARQHLRRDPPLQVERLRRRRSSAPTCRRSSPR